MTINNKQRIYYSPIGKGMPVQHRVFYAPKGAGMSILYWQKLLNQLLQTNKPYEATMSNTNPMNDTVYRSPETEALSMKSGRHYFEIGCLCLLNGELDKCDAAMTDADAVAFYMENCKCSRHPEGERGTE